MKEFFNAYKTPYSGMTVKEKTLLINLEKRWHEEDTKIKLWFIYGVWYLKEGYDKYVFDTGLDYAQTIYIARWAEEDLHSENTSIKTVILRSKYPYVFYLLFKK